MRRQFISLAILGFLLLGCSSAGKFFWLSDKSESASSAEDEASLVMLDAEAPIYLTPEERFDDVLRHYSDALDSSRTQRNVAAQRLFEFAIVNLADLQAESLNVAEDDLDVLREQLVSDYAHFLKSLPVLPAETSPSAVYLSLSEFLGDSITSWEDLLDVVLAPEVWTPDFDSPDSLQTYPDIPLVINSYVEEALVFFQTRGRKPFSKWLERSGDAVPYFTELLKKEGMPEELVYLSMIESGFSNIAYSRAHASGPWQFITSTARIYGLKVDKYYDQRRDPELSTHAAARYLKKLYNQFGDWYLAFASYNCGEGRVAKVVQRIGSYDYWKVRPHLPRQTRDYVPYYLAARIICQDPEKYGFEKPTFRKPSETGLVYVDGSVDLRVIAQCAECDYESVKALNPALKKGCTPPGAKNFAVHLPAGAGQNFQEKFAAVPQSKRQLAVSADDRSERKDWVRHRVRRGETLATIARKYGVSVKAISGISANKISNPNRISVGKYLLIPVRGEYVAAGKEPPIGTPQPPQLTSSDGQTRSIYTVRRGDTVAEIAQKFHVQASDIKTWNHLFGQKYIYPGQKLIVWTRSTGAASTEMVASAEKSSSRKAAASAQVHVVQPGDTLWDISRRYGVSVQNLKKWNSLRSTRRLMPGDEIKLSP